MTERDQRAGTPGYRLVRPARAAPDAPDLDVGQLRVVRHAGGPLMVLAGPGTGKTTTLVEAVVERVRRGVPIEHILVLTFARRAAEELRDRITARLDATVREPIARTFHSYAFGVLRMASAGGADATPADAATAAPGGRPQGSAAGPGSAHGGSPAPRLLSGAEQDIVLRELIAGDLAEGRSDWPEFLSPALGTRGFVAELRDLLLRAVERGVDGEALAGLGRRLGRPDWVAAGAFLDQYRDVTAFDRPGAYDAAELIQAAYRALDADPALLARERSRRRHIFVDEYQDTDPAQADLLALLATGAEELILVGDPDQSIYAFRGTDPDAMRRADDRFGLGAFQERTGQLFGATEPLGLPVVRLGTSRRSGPVLLAASRRVAANLPGPVGHRGLVAPDQLDPGRLSVSVVRSATEEAAVIASCLRRANLDDGVPWSRMAVIVRSTTGMLAGLRRALITAGVPTTTSGDDVPLAEQTAVSQLLTALRCVVRPEQVTDELAEALLLGAIGDSDAIQLRQVRREMRRLAAAAGEPGTGDLLAPLLAEPAAAAVLPTRLRDPFVHVADVLAAGRAALAAGGAAEDVLWAIWAATGLAGEWERRAVDPGPAGGAANRDLDAVIDLFAAAARLADRLPGATADALYEHVAAQQIPGESWARGAAAATGVQILTAHASKGREWDVVCVAGVQEGRWPDLRRRGSLLGSEFLVDVVAGRAEVSEQSWAPRLAEERRLFYVAVTRARKHLFITAVAGDDEQPSRFLDEIDPRTGDRAIERAGRGLHLADLVAELRRVVTDSMKSIAVRDEAARELARLAHAGVAGADPSGWWGRLELSDDRGLIDAADPARISPSQINGYLTCALKAFLDSAGAQEESTAKAVLGTIVHEIAELASAADELADLEAMMDDRWSGLDFGAPWYGRVQRRRASAMLARLSRWLVDSRAELALIGREVPFAVAIADHNDVEAGGGIQLRGSVDRLEVDTSGRLVIVDLKTSGTSVAGAKLAQHPQLGAYQLAVERGAFTAVTGGGTEEPGGARLVQLGLTTKNPEQRQAPLADTGPEWIEALVTATAGLQRGHRFDATVNAFCAACAVRVVCPAQAGAQVTEP